MAIKLNNKNSPGEISQNKEAERFFFDKFGEGNPYDVFDQKGYERIANEFLKYLKPGDSAKVIEFGCGTGAFTAKFLKYGFELLGVDISPKCVEYAAKRYPEIRFEVGDLEHTLYPDEVFDVVFLSGVLHHFKNYATVISECRRLLKKGGVLLSYDPNRKNPFMRVFRCRSSPFYVSNGVTENEQPLARKEVILTLSKCGFSNYKVYSISGVTYKYFDAKGYRLFLPVYNFLERMLDIRPLRDWFGSFLVTFAKK